MPQLQPIHDEHAVPARSLLQSLAFEQKLESWPLARSPSKLLPPFQPRRFQTPPPPPGVFLSHTHNVYQEDRLWLAVHYRHDRSLDSVSFSSLVLDRHVHTIYEEEDITCNQETHSFEAEEPSLYSKPACQPYHRLHSGDLDQESDKLLTLFSRRTGRRISLSGSRISKRPKGRSLTALASTLGYEMTTIATIPDSPPELSGSKSSKSSSYRSSSQLSSPDGIASDINNFEDIGLEDETQASSTDAFIVSRQNLPKRPVVQTVPIGNIRNKPSPMTTIRDLTTSKRRPSNSHGYGGRDASHVAEVAMRARARSTGPRRGFTSPSVPVLPMQRENKNRSRSQSPSVQPQRTSFSGYLGRPPPPSPGKLKPASRRSSWQPNRKTTKELEDEYHDSDDELPDDAALWNVPMSPRPPHERPVSARSSLDSQKSPGPPPIPLAHSVSAPADLPLDETDETSEIIPRNKLPPRTSSLQSPPPGPHYQASFRDMRAKSWTIAMSDLSEEARVLTEALEYHADDVGRKHDEKIQRGSKSARPSLETPKRTSRGMVELPPLQKGNVMIDPLPISKEKEKVLARTRPSWLPPKDPKEEKRHLREYQRMMAASIEAEKKKDAKERQVKLQKEEARAGLDQIWDRYVNPEWNSVVDEHRTRELWWNGISPKMRGAVWRRAIGNELALTEASYNKALRRAEDILSSDGQDDETKRVKRWFAKIQHDAATTYVDLNLFQQGSPMHSNLVSLLSAYAMYRNDVGYRHGLHLVAAIFLLQVSSPAEAFILLANCLNRPMSLAFLTSDPAATLRIYSITQQALAKKFPRAHDYLFTIPEDEGLGFKFEEILNPMFRTFLANGLDLERLARVWDCWVFEGDSALIRAVVATIGLLEGQICMTDGVDLVEKKSKIQSLLGWGPWGRQAGVWTFRELDGGDEDGFMQKVRDAGRLD